MDNRKLAYDDVAPPGEMAADCFAVERELSLDLASGSGVTLRSPEWHLTTPEVSNELAAMAADLELHLG